MSLDLKTARTSVKSRVETIVGAGNAHIGQIPAGFQPPRDAMNRMAPYAVLHFGRPVPDFGRTIADGEKDYPHTWPVAVYLYATDGGVVQDLADDLDASLLDWQPTGNDDSTPLRGGASFSYPLASTENMPARIELQRYYTCLVNMSRP